MFACYILRDLNQRHYIGEGSEIGAKFFTSELQAIKNLKTTFSNFTVSLYYFNSFASFALFPLLFNHFSYFFPCLDFLLTSLLIYSL